MAVVVVGMVGQRQVQRQVRRQVRCLDQQRPRARTHLYTYQAKELQGEGGQGQYALPAPSPSRVGPTAQEGEVLGVVVPCCMNICYREEIRLGKGRGGELELEVQERCGWLSPQPRPKRIVGACTSRRR